MNSLMTFTVRKSQTNPQPVARCLILISILCALAWSGVTVLPAPAVEVKLGTILPEGIGQDFVLTKLTQDWRKVSGGATLLRKAPGAQRNGEAGIVRMLRSGNYQAALLSAVGLAEIAPEAAVLQYMPLAFRDWAEVDFVREKLGGRLEEHLRNKGFVLLFWADAGWVNFFSVRKGLTPDDFRRMKMFTWVGDDKQIQIMKSLRYQPVALETDNVLMGFGNGMIEAAPLPPVFALGLQIQTQARHVLELNWTPIVGAAIIREDVWKKIPADVQIKLRGLCESAGAEIRAEGRRFHEDALKTLRKGPSTQVHALEPQHRAEWQKFAEELGPKVRGQLVPATIYDEVQSLLIEFRRTQTARR